MNAKLILAAALAVFPMSLLATQHRPDHQTVQPDRTASPSTTNSSCFIYSNNNSTSGTLAPGQAVVVAQWTQNCTGNINASIVSSWDEYQIQVLVGGTWSYIYDSGESGSSGYLYSQAPGTYRIVVYNPSSVYTSNYQVTYSRPVS